MEIVLSFDHCDCVLSALDHLLKVFPFTGPNVNQANMAARLLEVGLANVEIIAPRFASMINYCAAEGIDQSVYLQSLIDVKFKKKLHHVKRSGRR